MEKLAKRIIAFLSTRPWPKKRPKNWVLKLLSLFFAIFLWYFVVGEDKVDMNVVVPVEIVNLPRNLVISNQFKKELDVLVSGQRRLITGLSGQHISRSVDLSDAGPGKVVVHNEPDAIPFPRGVSVLRIQPTSLTLLLDKLIQKELRVKAVIKGAPAAGYELAGLQLEPTSIVIAGPAGVLSGEDYLKTNKIDIANMKAPTLKEVTLNLKPAIADLIGETVVTARIKIREKTTKRLVANIPVKLLPTAVRQGDKKIRLLPATVDVRAELPLSLLNNTRDLKSLFPAVVNFADFSAGKHELRVHITTPPDVHVVNISPASVMLEISERKRKKNIR